MVTITSPNTALARFTNDSIASDSRPTESVITQASVFSAIVTTATTIDAINRRRGVSKRIEGKVMPRLCRGRYRSHDRMRRMRQQAWQGLKWWIVGGDLLALAGAALLARQSLDEQRAQFDTDARIVHRLLSQQVVQHDAILATLALLQPLPHDAPGASPEQRLRRAGWAGLRE